ncbi:MAG: alpha/beta hydrolase [Leptospira sp.]|nr:alpha/beta hydrolase [Leptospira sp.]
MKINIFQWALIVSTLLILQCKATLTNRGESYVKNNYWYRYQHFYPEDLRFTSNNLPKEEYWEILGHKIHLDRYKSILPNSQCKMILLHGGGGNGRVLGNLAIGLQKLNCEIIAPDLLGFGLSIPNSDKPTLYEDWVNVISELIDKERVQNTKIYLFGLSMGGMLAYHIAAYNGKVDGVIATTLIDPRKSEVRDAIASNLFLSRFGIPMNQLFSFFTSSLNFPIKWFTKMELITNDPSFSYVFANDPYAGGSKVSLGFLNSYMYYKPKIEVEDFTICPILLAHPGSDPWTPVSLSETFFNKIRTPKRMLILDGAGHLPYEEPGKTQLFESIQLFLKN